MRKIGGIIMLSILLTKNSTFIIGPVSTLIGYLMNGIFYVLSAIGLPSVGLSIIIFTIIVYTCMTPLTIKQQKFSKLSAKMNPEIQAIQKKYEGKRDNDSMVAMNEETQMVYKKYGVSPSGSCIQLVIQLPIMWALYRVIYNMPAYVPSIKNTFLELVDKLVNVDGASAFLQTFKNASYYAKQFKSEEFVAGSTYMKNTFIDVLNKASSTEWMSLKEQFPSLSDTIQSTYDKLSHYNNFLGLNISDSPSDMIKAGLSAGTYGIVIGAILIPVLAAFTQFINVKLMPQANNSGQNEQADAMMASMKTMNLMMPIMSAIFCYTLPSCLGIYWIAGAVIRTIQQIAINKHIDKIDFDEMIQKNMEKTEKERRKKGVAQDTLNNAAHMNTKTISSRANMSSSLTNKEKEEAYRNAVEISRVNAKPGSITAKAHMVKDFNERNN
jgi:YidC/Oxa1 family membrane protein insertase